MAFDAWPGTVNNNAIRGSYNETPEEWNVDTFQVEEGPPLKSAGATNSSDRITYQLKLTATEWANLRTFWRTTLSSGVKYFSMTNPLSASSDPRCQFIEAPKLQSVQSVKYVVSVTVRRFNA